MVTYNKLACFFPPIAFDVGFCCWFLHLHYVICVYVFLCAKFCVENATIDIRRYSNVFNSLN